MTQKTSIKSQKLRDSAKGQECTLQIPKVCKHDPDTTVLCHFPDDTGTGSMAGKSDDTCAGFGCYDCHKLIDNLADFFKSGRPEADYWWFIHRSMVRTQRKWIEMGLVTIEGMK